MGSIAKHGSCTTPGARSPTLVGSLCLPLLLYGEERAGARKVTGGEGNSQEDYFPPVPSLAKALPSMILAEVIEWAERQSSCPPKNVFTRYAPPTIERQKAIG